MKEPKVFVGGHRGMGCTDHDFYQGLRDIAGLPVENSLASIEAAFLAGADYIETDAVMSADGVLFTLHNVVPKDHFFIPGKMPPELLNKMNFADIRLFGTGRGGSGAIDSLAEVLDKIAACDPRTLPWAVNIEIKGVQGSGQPYETNDYLQRLADTVKASALPVERVLFSSFSLQNVVAMSHFLPQAQYGMLFAEKPEARGIYADRADDVRFQYLPFDGAHVASVYDIWEKEAKAGVSLKYLHPEIMTVTPDMISAAAGRSAGINCWAIFEELKDDRKQKYAATLQRCGAQGVQLTIITDYIPEMKD